MYYNMNARKITNKAQSTQRTTARTSIKTTQTKVSTSIIARTSNSGFTKTTVSLTKSKSSYSNDYLVKLCTASVGIHNSTNGTQTEVSVPGSTLLAAPSVSLSIIIGVATPLTAFLALVVVLFLRYKLHILTLSPNSGAASEHSASDPPAPSLIDPPIELKYSVVYTNVGRKPRDLIGPIESCKSHRNTNIYMNVTRLTETSPSGDHNYCNVITPITVGDATKEDVEGDKSENVYTKLRDVSVVNTNPYNVFTVNVQNPDDNNAHLDDKLAVPMTDTCDKSDNIEDVNSPNNLTLCKHERVYFEVEQEL